MDVREQRISLERKLMEIKQRHEQARQQESQPIEKELKDLRTAHNHRGSMEFFIEKSGEFPIKMKKCKVCGHVESAD
jgi:uncharacterized Fe-S cluster-containing MiaB family protein